MDPVMGGALISSLGSVAGSLLDKTNVKHDSAHGETEGSIRAKMEAAKQYGISPLYMLGAPSVSGSSTVVGDNGLGNAVADMGANIGRAVAAKQTDQQRLLEALTLKRAGLENELLTAQINSINTRTRQQSAPPLPAAGNTSVYPKQISPDQFTGNYDFFGMDMKSNPYASDSQVVTNRLGESEILEMINAIGTGGMDAYWTIMNWLSDDPSYRKGNKLTVR